MLHPRAAPLYVYHRAPLANRLQAQADTVVAAGLPLDPDRFVAHIAAVWFDVEHPAHTIIKAAFADGP